MSGDTQVQQLSFCKDSAVYAKNLSHAIEVRDVFTGSPDIDIRDQLPEHAQPVGNLDYGSR
jgi:hypothetical protein